MDILQRAELAQRAARAAGELIFSHRDFKVSNKSSKDYVTAMDVKSEKFLKLAAERFNEVMRATQVYDSVLVKSSNMRSQNFSMKALTSFMAEPTLTINVLADAYLNRNEKGGKMFLAKALGLFDRIGSLEPGKRADIVLADGDFNVRAVYSRGEAVSEVRN